LKILGHKTRSILDRSNIVNQDDPRRAVDRFVAPGSGCVIGGVLGIEIARREADAFQITDKIPDRGELLEITAGGGNRTLTESHPRGDFKVSETLRALQADALNNRKFQRFEARASCRVLQPVSRVLGKNWETLWIHLREPLKLFADGRKCFYRSRSDKVPSVGPLDRPRDVERSKLICELHPSCAVLKARPEPLDDFELSDRPGDSGPPIVIDAH
jgi:hypothetical protein